ncbi:dTDP-4-dehydrorhamnose 3,5-epimerase [Fusobacterium sp.]|uniref:dTDP-4-dehydrorhamnose 3,5-epimerase family protein n=1 Tax=Fusobacterium sp. TaxID=68766 RepID=UPI002621D2D4|nr:dTDP-4-dehydrorhamnose 3,5-epimerase [Fusobacterium sp.]
MKFKIIEKINDILLIQMFPFEDERGQYMKLFSDQQLKEIGLETKFFEDNYLISKKGAIRGLHYQKANPEAKLLTCLKGRIIDIVCDVREDSENYGRFYTFEISSEDRRFIFIPEGFAHGFLSLEDSEVYYKSSNYYYFDDQYGVSIFSKELKLNEILKVYNIENLIITKKDKGLKVI